MCVCFGIHITVANSKTAHDRIRELNRWHLCYNSGNVTVNGVGYCRHSGIRPYDNASLLQVGVEAGGEGLVSSAAELSRAIKSALGYVSS